MIGSAWLFATCCNGVSATNTRSISGLESGTLGRPEVLARSAKYTGIEYRVIMNEVQVRFVKSFESRDEVRLLKKGRFEVVHLGGMTIGRAAYDRGRKWSEHVG